MPYQEIDTELLLLAASAASGSDYDRKEIVARIQDMTGAERALLRSAITTLDECYDLAIIELHANRRPRK